MSREVVWTLRTRRCPWCGRTMWSMGSFECGGCGVRWRGETEEGLELSAVMTDREEGCWADVPEGCLVVERDSWRRLG